jgi:asparagine synthase (glutamine-hydrolysing)
MNCEYAILLKYGETAGSDSTGKRAVRVTASADLNVRHLPDGGIVVGDCFPQHDTGEGLDAFDTADPIDFVRKFARRNWGRHIVVAIGSEPRRTVIYRDPSGMIPCYYLSSHGRIAIGTSASDILRTMRSPASIDWTSVANVLLAPDRRRRETCLKGISEVLPGEMAVIDEHGSCHQLVWDPSHFCGANIECEFEDAVERLRDTLIDVTKAWSGRYPRAVISISGGFDSSAIAALASQAGHIGLAHFYTTSPLADEREYAMAVADHISQPMACHLASTADIDVRTNLSRHRPRPSARIFTQAFDRICAGEADAQAANAHLNGGGGDNIFGLLHSAYPLVDQFKQIGLSAELWATARNICVVTGTSLPMVLRQAVKAAWKRDLLVNWPVNTDILTPYARSLLDPEPHPWLVATRTCAPGQKQHVRSVARATASTDYINIADSRPTIYPLLSRPLVELCLSYPTWFWFRGGRDRALARAATQPFLPELVTNRLGKAAFDGFLYRVWTRSRHEIIDDLKDGCLADHNLIDGSAIAGLQDVSNNLLSKPTRILHLHEVEMWCRTWA